MKDLIFYIVSILTILNPIAAAAIMVSLVKFSEVPNVSKKTSIAIFIASVITMLAGGYILKFFGINIPSIKSIGGVILLIISVNMVQGNSIVATNSTDEEHSAAQEKDEIAIIPLAIPILFGPGLITTLIVLNQKAITFFQKLELFSAILLSSVITYIILRNATSISRFLGVNGLKIVTRIMGLVIGAIAFLFLISGIKALWIGEL